LDFRLRINQRKNLIATRRTDFILDYGLRKAKDQMTGRREKGGLFFSAFFLTLTARAKAQGFSGQRGRDP
jgi:hypothetical protein